MGLGVDSLIRASLSVIVVALMSGTAFGVVLNTCLTQMVLQIHVAAALRPDYARAWRLWLWATLWTVGVIGTMAATVLGTYAGLPASVVPAFFAFDVVGLGFAPQLLIRRWQPEVWAEHAAPIRSYSRFMKYRRAALGIAYWAVPVFLTFLTVAAISTADQVRGGGSVDAWLLPWHATPARVFWASGTGSPSLPSCRHLRYLGTADGRVVLFETQSHIVYRLPARNVTVATGSGVC